MSPKVSLLVCAGCGHAPDPLDPEPFRCRRAVDGDGIDHVVAHRLGVLGLSAVHGASDAASARDYWAGVFAVDRADPSPESANPFLRYREFLHSWHAALDGGMSEDDWCDVVMRLDRAIADVDGWGFRDTVFRPVPELAAGVGLAPPGAIWVKDETANVSGSHKARHLMGIMIWLEVMIRLGRLERESRRLAIASCGNAALAAAVVARAARWELDVFIPADADAVVVTRLEALGAQINVCRRIPGEAGDPTYLAFRRAVANGAIPFSCQGNENGMTIDGGKTLAFEIASELLRTSGEIDRLFVQVGGGALASSVIQGLSEAHGLGLIRTMPVIHAVQTEGGHPLVRAWQHFVARFGYFPGPAGGRRPVASQEIARLNEAMTWAARHRPDFMWPWETTPRSVAHGILDDETYDWLAVVRGMAATGGCPVLADEALLLEAVALARAATGVPVDATGAAGLAGFMAQKRRNMVNQEDRVAVLLTGAERGAC